MASETAVLGVMAAAVARMVASWATAVAKKAVAAVVVRVEADLAVAVMAATAAEMEVAAGTVVTAEGVEAVAAVGVLEDRAAAAATAAAALVEWAEANCTPSDTCGWSGRCRIVGCRVVAVQHILRRSTRPA